MLFIGVSSDGSGLVKNWVHTHYSKDNDSKHLNPQDIYLQFAKVTSSFRWAASNSWHAIKVWHCEYLSQFFFLNFSRFVSEEL